MQARSFFLATVFCVLGLLALLSVFNWLINPILLYSSPAVDGVNRYKSQWFFSQLIAKPYAVRRQKPDALILGTSRAGFTLSPEHPAWHGYAPYNYSLAGTTTLVQWHSFRHATEIRKIRQLVLGLDAFMFNSCRLQESEQPVIEYLQRLKTGDGSVNWHFPRRALLDHAESLFSLDITRKSWRTIMAQDLYVQGVSSFVHAEENGFWSSRLQQGVPQRRAFLVIEKQYMGSDWFPAPGHCYSLEREGVKFQLEYLEKIVRHAYAGGTRTHLFFSPFHARLAEAMGVVGIWDDFEQLKRDVLQLTESVALELGVEPFPVWDFSGYNSINTEIVPPGTDGESRMRWYYDSTHGTALLGDLVQDRLFGMSTIGNLEAPDFGVLLNPGNIDAHLASVRTDRAAYREAHPQDVKEVGAAASKLLAVSRSE